MRKFGLLGSSALRSAALVGMALAAATPAFAQPTTPNPAKKAPTDAEKPENLPQNEVANESGRDPQAATGEQIIITGTRINRPNLTSGVPITSVGIQDLTRSGNVSIGDELQQLPQMRASFTTANSSNGGGRIGTAGVNALDLRGLGSTRTLVLVNGRRHISISPGSSQVDVNTIPSDLIDRVDIVTGGNSAIYGSDAVAGVVNFVMKRDYDGIRLRGQSGISSRGDRGSYFGSITFGRNFADGRGNFALEAEYSKQNTVDYTDRDAQTGAFSGRSQDQLTENTGNIVNPGLFNGRTDLSTCNIGGVLRPCIPGETSAGNGLPDRTFLRNIRNVNISEGGNFNAACPTVAAAGETAAQFAARRAAACTGVLNPGSTDPLSQFGRNFVFDPAGNLVPINCQVDFRFQTGGASNNCIGGLGSTLRLEGPLTPGVERKAINGLAHFELSPAFVPFLEGKYVRVSANTNFQPTFTTGILPTTFSVNNPFLSAQARQQILALMPPAGTASCTLNNGVNPTQVVPNGPCFATNRFNVDLGGRGERHFRDTWEIVGGVSGKFLGNWKYEVSATYGETHNYFETTGNILLQNYLNAINAVKNAQGQIVCAINATTVTDPACVPINLFGQGAPSQAAINYVSVTSTRRQKGTMFDGIAYVSGDIGSLFTLPGGPIGFVVGGEYRRETAFSAYDPTTASGATFFNQIPDFAPPAQVVKDAFGEVNIPFLRDLPWAQELSVDAAGRYTNYNIGKTGTVFAWNINGIYAPVRDVRFRVGFARAIRAPTQVNLYNPFTTTFVTIADPCSATAIAADPTGVRGRNCAAAGVPTSQTFNGSTEAFTNRTSQTVQGLNGANPNLEAEKSTSFTAGVVLQPRFIRGFSMTIDYYHINLTNVILTLGAQTVANLCYSDPGGINNQYCAAIFRNPNGTFIGQADVTHGGQNVPLVGNTGIGKNGFIQGPFNFAKQTSSGVDVDMAYRTTLGPDTRLNLRAIVTRTFKRNNYFNTSDPTFASRQLTAPGDPMWQANASLNLEHGIYNFGYRFRFYSKQVFAGAYETQHSFQGRPPTDPDAFDIVWYPAITYHDFRLDISPTKRYNFFLGVDNAFDRLPPLDLIGNEAGIPYNPVGRFFYAGATVKF